MADRRKSSDSRLIQQAEDTLNQPAAGRPVSGNSAAIQRAEDMINSPAVGQISGFDREKAAHAADDLRIQRAEDALNQPAVDKPKNPRR